MIHFDKNLCALAKQIIKAKEHADITNDLADIENHLKALQVKPTTEQTLTSAKNLDKNLHIKYPTIAHMLDIGSACSTSNNMYSQQYLSVNEELQSNLTQDYFGILCHSLIKDKKINKIEQFIDYVD